MQFIEFKHRRALTHRADVARAQVLDRLHLNDRPNSGLSFSGMGDVLPDKLNFSKLFEPGMAEAALFG